MEATASRPPAERPGSLAIPASSIPGRYFATTIHYRPLASEAPRRVGAVVAPVVGRVSAVEQAQPALPGRAERLGESAGRPPRLAPSGRPAQMALRVCWAVAVWRLGCLPARSTCRRTA